VVRDKKTSVGLIGGSLERRLETSKIEPLELEYVLAPYRRKEDTERLAEYRATRPFHVEVGFGRPHYLSEFAAAHPEARILGYEVKRRWCRMASNRAKREGLENLRVIEGDARAYMANWSIDESVDGFHILFPDPWWKKRHHKRRLFNEEFVELLFRLLVPGGAIVFRTDVGPYADQVLEVMNNHGGFKCEHEMVEASAPRSHREKKCASLEIPVSSYRFVKLRN
jgi:tRNA (guanine-N(7)-)-methyltransferase